jgi:DNA-binding NtrC family response regulator
MIPKKISQIFGRAPKLLAVDDEKDLLNAMAILLTAAGCEVDTACVTVQS